MGVFHEQVEVSNRAPVDLTVTFDGQSVTLKPGKNFLPKVCVQYAKNQNPIMGSQNPYDPNINGCRYLIGVVGTKDEIAPLTKEEWEDHRSRPCREDEQAWFADHYGNDAKAKLIVRGKGRATAANSRYDAGGVSPGISSFDNK